MNTILQKNWDIICLVFQLRNPKEVSTEEYNEFYKKAFNEYLDPLASSHFTTEVIMVIAVPLFDLWCTLIFSIRETLM